MKKFLREFREFALKGNAFDLAVGVIIGSAFSAIVTSLVKDILMPLLGIVLGRVNIAGLTLTIPGFLGSSPIVLTYGAFLQSIVNFVIIALCIFCMIKVVSRLHVKEEKEEKKTDPTLAVLTEIRNLLQEKQEHSQND